MGKPFYPPRPPPKNEIDLRRAEALTWGERPSQTPSAPLPSIVASNYKEIGKGYLVGKADLFVTKWRMTIYGAMWFKKGEKEWVNFPSNEWTDASGTKHYFPFCKLERQDDQDKFSEMAVVAFRRIAGGAP